MFELDSKADFSVHGEQWIGKMLKCKPTHSGQAVFMWPAHEEESLSNYRHAANQNDENQSGFKHIGDAIERILKKWKKDVDDA